MLLFSEFFSELTFLSWVNHFMSNVCCLKADCFIERLNLVASGLFKILSAELNPICHLLALLGSHHILHLSMIRVKFVEFYDLGLPL